MRYLLRIVTIVVSLLVMALAVCSGEDRTTPWFDQAFECSELTIESVAPVQEAWPDGSPCAGASRTVRFKALANGTAVACDPSVRTAAIWQNRKIADIRGDHAVAYCASLCRDPVAPEDPSRCSEACRDADDASRCDPALLALAWRLPEAAELETLIHRINDTECTIQGCRMDPVLAGDCDYYWAAGLEDPTDPGNSDRAVFDLRSAGSGYDPVELPHPVRCVADRP